MSFVGKNIDKALDRTLARTPTARSVLAQLARHASRDTFHSRPSQGLIARRAGINTRQVRTYLRELEALGEIVAIKKGANRPTEYFVAILSNDVFERQHIATPQSEMDRQSTTEPKDRWTGSVASVDRQCAAYEVLEEDSPRSSTSKTDGGDWVFAEKGLGS